MMSYIRKEKESVLQRRRKKGRNERNNALAILCSHGTVKREKEEANARMSLLYYVAMVL